jgi:hypothetical protein
MMDVISKPGRFKVNKWGMSGIAAMLASFLALALCQKLFKDDRNACLVPYLLLNLSAAACGIVSAVRGSKWWWLMSLLSAALAIQAFVGMVIE